MCKETVQSESYKNQMTLMLSMCSHIKIKKTSALLYGDNVILKHINLYFYLDSKRLKVSFQG